MVTGTVPHVGGPILPPGEPTVLIGGLPAARVGDMSTCTGPPDSIAVGSYFRFRVVFRNQPADLAAIKVYTYADRDDGAVLIHQSTYPYPPRPSKNSPYGFSGLHHVYEPVRDGELQYWCEWRAGGGAS